MQDLIDSIGDSNNMNLDLYSIRNRFGSDDDHSLAGDFDYNQEESEQAMKNLEYDELYQKTLYQHNQNNFLRNEALGEITIYDLDDPEMTNEEKKFKIGERLYRIGASSPTDYDKDFLKEIQKRFSAEELRSFLEYYKGYKNTMFPRREITIESILSSQFGRKVRRGKRGGMYYIKKGRKVYV